MTNKFVDLEDGLKWLSDNWDRLKEEGKLWEPTPDADLEVRTLSDEGRTAFQALELETDTWIQTDQGMVLIRPQEGYLREPFRSGPRR